MTDYVFVPGNLYCRGYSAESTYGTTTTGALAWFGSAISLGLTADYAHKFIAGPGSRAFTHLNRGPFTEGLLYKCYIQASSWTQYLTYGWGAAATTADRLGSFSLVFDVYDGTNHYYLLFNGCKINRWTLTGVKVGEFLELEMEIFCQHMEVSTTKAFVEIASVTVGADASAPGGANLTWNGNSVRNIGGNVTWYPETWKLTIDNHLEREFGSIAGNSGGPYPVVIALNEGERDIILEANEITIKNFALTSAKKANTAVTTVTLPLDTSTITMSTGRFEANDFPTFAQAVNREACRIRFQTIAVA